MKSLFWPLVLVSLLSACTLTDHPVQTAKQGKPIGSAEMERLLDIPGPVRVETVTTADWEVPLAGLVNLKNLEAQKAGLQDRSEPIQVYAHVLHHPAKGNFLVDTGMPADASDAGIGLLVRMAMGMSKLKPKDTSDKIVARLGGKVDAVLFTHLHIDHIGGMRAIPAATPLLMGPHETEGKSWQNAAVRGSTNALFDGKAPLQELAFQPDPDKQFDGVLDLFGDGSIFAISVAGHTPGSVAYVARTPDGPVLLTGDTSHTRWGWEHGVEPGEFTADHARNHVQLKRLIDLAKRHPGMAVRLGHQA